MEKKMMMMMMMNNSRWKYPIPIVLLGVAALWYPFKQLQEGTILGMGAFLQVFGQGSNSCPLPALCRGHLLYRESKYWNVIVQHKEIHLRMPCDQLLRRLPN
jgi:hypothetical protein